MNALFASFVDDVNFATESKVNQAAILVWAISKEIGGPVPFGVINDTFDKLGFPKANPTRLKQALAKSRNVRSGGKGLFLPTNEFGKFCSDKFAHLLSIPAPTSQVLNFPPYLSELVVDKMTVMQELYQLLYLLENSMRAFIEKRLLAEYGASWWEKVSNSSMRQKHETRTKNESTNKWAPSRAELGPLYSIDWVDLLSLIRKEHRLFSDKIPDPSFLHRFDDLGHFRNVVAHNGVISDESAIQRIKMYVSDWAKQIA